MINRALSSEIRLLAGEYPVVTLLGPRQSGKTTLAKAVFPEHTYVNLESPDMRTLASQDPRAFFRSYPAPIIIDEIQRVPELCSYIQVIVDENPVHGSFILTGSSQMTLHTAITQSLAGRNAITKLFPLTFSELASLNVPIERDQLLVSGFFPRVHHRNQEPSRAYKNYIQTYIERDLRSSINIKNMAAFERFLGLLAGRIGQLVNLNSLASDTGVSSTTLAEWLNILEASFVVYRLSPFFENYGKRLTKSPKLYFTDVGLASALLSIRTPQAAARDPLLGNLFENMIVMEAVKQISNRGDDSSLYFFRDQNGREIDLIIDHDRTLTPVEIKAAMTWNPEFAKQIIWFQHLSPRAGTGKVIYAGNTPVTADSYQAVPFQSAQF